MSALHESECAVIGSLLLGNHLAEGLSAEDFSLPAHRFLYQAIEAVVAETGSCDPTLVRNEMAKTDTLGALASVGGPKYLDDLLVYYLPDTLAYHARIVTKASDLRRLQAVLAETLAQTRQADCDPDETFGVVEQRLLEISMRRKGQEGAKHVSAVVREVHRDLEARRYKPDIVGIPSGFGSLDDLFGGWQPGDLTLIAARPSMGKTAMLLQALLNAARLGHPALIISMEMKAKALISRLLANDSGVFLGRFREPHTIPQDRWIQLEKSVARLSTLPLWIEDISGLRASEVRAKARRWRAKHGAGSAIIGVDYLQLIRADRQTKDANRNIEVSEVSSSMKEMAMELNVPALVLSQLNRGVEQRPNKRPMMSDLRDSGSLEQDADNIAFLYRDDYYHKDKSDRPGVAEFIVAKQRNGPTETVEFRWIADRQRFEEIAPEASNYPRHWQEEEG